MHHALQMQSVKLNSLYLARGHLESLIMPESKNNMKGELGQKTYLSKAYGKILIQRAREPCASVRSRTVCGVNRSRVFSHLLVSKQLQTGLLQVSYTD